MQEIGRRLIDGVWRTGVAEEASPNGNGGSQPGMRLLVRPITPAELLAITDATPLEVLPGVPGSTYGMIDTGFSFKVGTTQYTDGADLFISLGPTANGWFDKFAFASDIIGASDALSLGGFTTVGWNGFQGTHLDPTQFDGQAIKVFLDPSGAPNTPFGGGGDGIVTLYFQYTLTTL